MMRPPRKPYEFDCHNHSIFNDLTLNRALFAERQMSTGPVVITVVGGDRGYSVERDSLYA
jgi:hypothetical protein